MDRAGGHAGRWAPLLAALLLLLSLAPGAGAEPSASFQASVRLLDQPHGRAWGITLGLAGEFSDAEGIDAQPVLETLTFELPEATVNAGGVPTCSADPVVSIGDNFDPCPPRLAVGHGTSDVQLRRPQGIDLRGRPPFYWYHLRLALYIGPRVPGGRVLMVIGTGINSPLTVIMRGVLSHTAAGWTYRLPIPLVRDPQIGVMKVVRFAMRAGGWTRARPRRRFLEAPRSCPDGGFAFALRSQFEGVALLSATRTIACELTGR